MATSTSIEVVPSTNSHRMLTRGKAGIVKTKQPYVGAANRTPEEEVEPETTREALKRAEWKTAIEVEFKAFISNGTWILVPYQGQKNIIDSK